MVHSTTLTFHRQPPNTAATQHGNDKTLFDLDVAALCEAELREEEAGPGVIDLADEDEDDEEDEQEPRGSCLTCSFIVSTG